MAMQEVLDEVSVKNLARVVAEVEQEIEEVSAGEEGPGQEPQPQAEAQPVTFISLLEDLDVETLKQVVREIKNTLAGKLVAQEEGVEMLEFEG